MNTAGIHPQLKDFTINAFNSATGKMFFGAGYRTEQIIIPCSAKTGDGRIKCRHCDEYKKEIDEETSLRSLAKTIGKMRTHETLCCKKTGYVINALLESDEEMSEDSGE